MSDKSTASFSSHMRATLLLGMPIVGSQIAQMLIGIVDTIMLGWLGTEELAAGILAFTTYFVFLIFGLGFGAAMMPLIGMALGRDDPQAVRRACRMGVWALVGLASLFMLPMWFTGDILVLLGQKPELSKLASNYMRIAQWSMIPAMIIIGLRAILTTFERANYVFIVTIITAVLNAVFNYMFIFGNWGAPRLELEGAAVATVLANLIGAGILFVIVANTKSAKTYALFVRLWRPDWMALKEVIRLGVPISLMIFSEAGMFSAAAIMIGWIGTVPLAAHGIAIQITSVAFMIPLGFSQAGTIRVSRAFGAGDQVAVTRAAYSVVLLALLVGLISALVFVLMPGYLASLFLDKANANAVAVIAYAVPLMWVAAAFQLVDSLQVVASGNLRGLKDTKIPLVVAVISYWGIGLCTGYYLAFVVGLEGVGVWMGLASGLTFASLFLSLRFARREKLGLLKPD